MKDTFSRQQWVEFTCGVAPVELKFAMDDHIGRCEECRAISRRFENVERELVASVAILHASINAGPPESAYEAWKEQLPPDWEGKFLARRVVRLQLFLAPICGFGTAQRAMLVAAGRSAAESLDALTEREWLPFLGHLSSIVGALCGELAGRLLWRIGQPLAAEVL